MTIYIVMCHNWIKTETVPNARIKMESFYISHKYIHLLCILEHLKTTVRNHIIVV